MMPIIRYKITGTGIIRALQKATDEKKDLVIVHDKGRLGQPVNVGYYLVPRGAETPANPNIIRFDLKEIEISVDNTNSDFIQPVLGAEFHHPRKNERHFLLNLSIDEDNQFVLRNLFRLTNGVTSRFVIQVELLNLKSKELNSKPVVRYDQSHGFIHRDMIAVDGTKTKYKVKTHDVKTAIIFAIDEIRDNLSHWLQQLGYVEPDQQVLRQEQVVQELDRAKLKLLELYDNPSKMKDIQSSYFHLSID